MRSTRLLCVLDGWKFSFSMWLRLSRSRSSHLSARLWCAWRVAISSFCSPLPHFRLSNWLRIVVKTHSKFKMNANYRQFLMAKIRKCHKCNYRCLFMISADRSILIVCFGIVSTAPSFASEWNCAIAWEFACTHRQLTIHRKATMCLTNGTHLCVCIHQQQHKICTSSLSLPPSAECFCLFAPWLNVDGISQWIKSERERQWRWR